jgi:hypothetical protein
VGAAAHRASGQLGLVLSSTAAAAALYGAVVLIGPGPSSPLVLDQERTRPQPAVHLRVHDLAAPDPAARGPQPSPGRAQQQTRVTRVPQPTRTAAAAPRLRPALVPRRKEAQASSQTDPSDVDAPLPVPVPAPAPPPPVPPVAVAVVVPTLPAVSLPPLLLPTLPVLTP